MSKNRVIHTQDEIVRIRRAGQLTALVRDQIAAAIQPGMTTWDLDQLAGEYIRATGGRSAFLGYCGFPGNICISVNEEVIHGIGVPTRIINPGDIVSVDVGVEIDGALGDTATTVAVGEVSPDVKRLLQGTQDALASGIAASIKGHRVRHISAAVEKVANKAKLGIVRDFVGHGCGTKLHEPPEIPNYTSVCSGVELVPGMVICIEPMFTLGNYSVVVDRADSWTVRTRDKSFSAHYEHMILITEDKPEILTWQKTM